MVSIVGLIIVVASVIVGFSMAGGHLAVLIQPSEFIVIGGAVIGSFVIATPLPYIKVMIGSLPKLLKGGGSGHDGSMQMLKLLFEVSQMSRTEGVLSLEPHVEQPDKSDLFSKYPEISADKTLLTYLCDSIKMFIVGGLSPHELDDIMEKDLEVLEEESKFPSHSLAGIADALPGLGIVAAVLGIVITMQSIGGDPAEVGHHVAAALVGTFLGVLGAYGIVSPIGQALNHQAETKVLKLHALRCGISAFARGQSPIMTVEFARRAIPELERPSFAETERECKALKVKPAK